MGPAFGADEIGLAGMGAATGLLYKMSFGE